MPTDLTGFDYIVLTLVGLLALMGFVRGLTQEALSLAAWIAGAFVVRFFHEPATEWLAPRTGGEASGATVAFLALFFGTVIIGRIIAGMASGATRRSGLGAMDRVLGLGFGAVKGVILATILFLLTQFTTGLFDPNRQVPDWLMHARSTPLLQMSADAMVGWVHDLRGEAGEGASGLDGSFTLPPRALPGRPKSGETPGSDRGERVSPRDQGGYSEEDREALDRILDDKGIEI